MNLLWLLGACVVLLVGEHIREVLYTRPREWAKPLPGRCVKWAGDSWDCPPWEEQTEEDIEARIGMTDARRLLHAVREIKAGSMGHRPASVTALRRVG